MEKPCRTRLFVARSWTAYAMVCFHRGYLVATREQSMPTIKLAKKALNALPTFKKPIIFYDTDLKGFGLKVMPSGVKSWIVEFRPGSGGRGVTKRRIVIGSTTTLTPEQARKLATETL